MEKYKLVIFDCDGVLVDSEKISAEIIVEVLGRAGIKMTVEESYRTFVGGSMSKILEYVKNTLGHEPKVDIEKEYRRLSFEAYKKKMMPVEGVETILKTLKISKCVGSNGPKNKIELNLNLTGLKKYFEPEHIFSAYDIQKWKPDPALYLTAALHFGIAPSQCIVIEDSVHGLKAAAAAGMRSFGISHPMKPLPTDIKSSEVYMDMKMIKNRLNELGVLN